MNRNRSTQTPLSLFSFQDIITSVAGIFMLMTLLLAVVLTTRTVTTPHPVPPVDIEAQSRDITTVQKHVDELRAEVAHRSEQQSDFGEYTPNSAAAKVAQVAEAAELLRARIQELRIRENKLLDDLSSAEAAWSKRASDVTLREELRDQLSALEGELAQLKNSQRVFYNNVDASGRQVLLVELFDADILVTPAGEQAAPRRFSGPGCRDAFLDWAAGRSAARCRFVLVVHPGTTKTFRQLSDALREKGFSLGYDLLPADKIAIDIQRGAG